MAIADAIQFETFNTEGASNGSGIELGDDFNTFRKKTNGIINSGGGRLKIFAHTLIKYVNNQLSFENNFNIANVVQICKKTAITNRIVCIFLAFKSMVN